MKRSHLVIFSASAGLLLAGFVMTAFLWNQIPAIIPTHFGPLGTPDAWSTKSFVMLFLVPLAQAAIFLLLTLIYKYPQYSNWPTTLILMTVEEEKREKVFEVIRSMLAWLLLIISSMFAYLQYIILATANKRANGLAPWIMFSFLGVLAVVIVYVNVRMLVTVKHIVKSAKS